MSAEAAAYQELITGRPATQSYVVNGVKFDGFSNGVLQDAKGPGYANFVKDGTFASWYSGQDELAEQAQRQLAAAGGVPISWFVAEQPASEAIQNLFADRGISGINVIYAPPNG
jgi:filamentous hemagglutinin